MGLVDVEECSREGILTLGRISKAAAGVGATVYREYAAHDRCRAWLRTARRWRKVPPTVLT